MSPGLAKIFPQSCRQKGEIGFDKQTEDEEKAGVYSECIQVMWQKPKNSVQYSVEEDKVQWRICQY